ncbi:MAG: NUDIX domain-containing protein [Proteobacteria bacterium]|nr:NUDIX domain-containing protein [Pseudomonadota bacterium]
MVRTAVITVFLTRNKKLLLLRRSQKVGTYQGCWAGVSGYLDTDNPIEQAWTELNEELGVGTNEAALEVEGETLEVTDHQADRTWIVHPFRFVLFDHAKIRLDWEHVEMSWSTPETMQQLDTVPGLWKAWCNVVKDFNTE